MATKTEHKVVWPLSQLTPWDKNPRAIDKKDFARLKKQLTKHKQYKPLLINQDGVILGGNMRYQAMKDLGLKDAWVSIVDAKTEKDMVEYALSDNDRAGYYLNDAVAELVLSLDDFDLDLYHIDQGKTTSVQKLVDRYQPVVEDDFDIDEAYPETALTQAGDVYQLGTHRLICGDATNEVTVKTLLQDTKVDLMVTDPPYGVDYGSKNDFLNKFDKGNRVQKDIANDAITNYREWFGSWLSLVPWAKQNSAYIFMSGLELHNLRLALEDVGMHFSQYLIWEKNNHVIGRQDYANKHEWIAQAAGQPIVYGWQGTHIFQGDAFFTTILKHDRPNKSELHPTMKPVGLIADLIKNSSTQRQVAYEPFCGSGTTLIACEQLDRQCYAIELDPKYCDVIIARWEKFTGQKAEKL